MRRSRLPSELPIVAVALVIWALFSLTVEGFGTHQTATNILGASVTDGLLAVGLTVCLLAGQIDLSIGSNLALSGVVFATLQPRIGLPAAIVIGVLCGTAVGGVNAILVTVIGIESFVATLGMLLLVQGLAFVVSNGQPVNSTDLSFSLSLQKPVFGLVTPSVMLLVAATVAVHFFVTRMRWGREIVAIGGSLTAVEAAGVPVRRRLVVCFLISGTLSGLAGVELSASLLSGSPIVGGADLLTAAAACFLGGVALTGGRGSVLSSAFAVIALAALATGLELSFINAAYQQVITGVVLLVVATPALATLFLRWRRRPTEAS